MARHRKIDMRMHGDEKVRRLTPPQPCGQALWWNLLAGPQTDIIPGLCSIGESGFAELLRWPLEGFRKAFGEVFREGLAKADWEAQLLFVPNAIKYNLPANPNVIKSWRSAWDELPECGLKNEAKAVIFGHLKGLGKGFLKAFQGVLGNPFNNPFNNPLPNPLPNQEQEQEQDLRERTRVRDDQPVEVAEGVASDQVAMSPADRKLAWSQFCFAYPNNTHRDPRAREVWELLPMTPKLLAEILAGLSRWMRSGRWSNKRYIPNAQNFIEREYWLQEIEPDEQERNGKPVRPDRSRQLGKVRGSSDYANLPDAGETAEAPEGSVAD